jgi:diaminopimelate epimerase
VELTKHHGLGNDFLVLIADERAEPCAELARAVCDRRTGVGADGLVIVGPAAGDAVVTMVLLNADGSRAEMSGNGISCLAQAVVMGGLVPGPVVTVDTDAGTRTVEVRATDDPGTHEVTVDMGPVTPTDDAPDWVGDGVAAAGFADAGNPHLVLHTPDPERAPDLVTVGRAANAAVAGGVNVEMIRVDGDHLRLEVYERGVGPTLACGTGAAAAAAVASRWGLVGDRVAVVMPGGRAHLALGSTVSMTVPVVAVARVDYLRA